MQAGFLAKPAIAGLLVLWLGSCEEGTFGSNSFRGQYVVARDALEAGNYARANRTYAKMLDTAGPVRPRIELEYAHSQLRAGNYAAAAKQARQLAARQQDVGQSAALAVQATAEHELGLAALAAGDRAGGQRFLVSADKAITHVLKHHPGLDPLGALAGRQASIQVRLKAL